MNPPEPPTLSLALTPGEADVYSAARRTDRPLVSGAGVPADPQSVRMAAAEHRDRASIAAAIGASERQLRNWQQRHPEISNALHLGDADRLARDFHLCLSVGSYGAF